MPQLRGGPVRCLVAVDLGAAPWLCELALAPGATVAEAVLAAQQAASGQPGAGGFDWEHAATGIWGHRCPRDQAVCAGDRVELYRPLLADPRERRRRRAGVSRGPLRRRGA
jgi:putative ubiquitin-RnfH superfamily antitoxin RatB of RatAB toxin-antitoxin module